MFRTFGMVLVVSALAALASAGALAGTPKTYTQPVIGTSYAATSNPGGCVKVGDSMQVVNELKNTSDKPQTINVYIYGVGNPNTDPSMMKGPLLDVDTAKSGLSATTDPTVWLWSITLRPNQSVVHILFVKNVPAGYYPANWNPAWGSAPWPTLYTGGTGYVRYSRNQVQLYAQAPYCTLDGSIPYTIPTDPGTGK